MNDHPRHAPPARAAPPNPGHVVWLVSGVILLADRNLAAALHKLANQVHACAVGLHVGHVSGMILHGALRVSWSIAVPDPAAVARLVDRPDPETVYRLLTLTATRYPGGP
ncbi:hypothetical protein [Arenibaculum sp.]|uniref:hypothetical protein n=1 Tax=Arenibaculum sp. TaxID=2865862 RepID=UPI002E101F7F|nr:hypothetical protein [Arenibaculum sp.]